MVAGCLGASCHPGRVVSGGILSRADCLGAGCHRGGVSRGAMSLHPEYQYVRKAVSNRMPPDKYYTYCMYHIFNISVVFVYYLCDVHTIILKIWHFQTKLA